MSKSIESQIEQVLLEKEDKSDIEYNKKILHSMVDLKLKSNLSKDEIFLECSKIELILPSLMEKHWKKSGCSVSGGSGYRQETVRMFIESDGKVTQKEWESRMIDGGFLKKIINYRQHFATFYHLYHHEMMK